MVIELLSECFERMPQQFLQPKTDVYSKPTDDQSEDQYGEYTAVEQPCSRIQQGEYRSGKEPDAA
ncbi:hypothetical protein M472_09250 [Sphingobacterium paucimobilis HER1398]|uniref:Uncharacterized protein n=1 Tax=Sphingobacterium paucimobilis HER1398 TaxID=1346330 RepID=U2HTW6_9SPHI|nr:hypothetical protein M472_09250 [Sphingobacterium paucimobilis HER1398]